MTSHLFQRPPLVITPARCYLLAPSLPRQIPDGLVERILRALRTVATDLPRSYMHASSVASVSGRDTTQHSTSGSGDLPPDEGRPAESQITMEQLVHDHADAVYRVALSITKDPVLAEDISQDVLIKAWQSLPSYRAEAPIRHWILRITHNMSISTLRRRREDIVAPADLPEHATNDRSVDVQVQDRMAIARFEAALGDLDGVSRSIVVLREVEGLSYAEMSTLLELPLPTIRTRLLRARRQLAVALDGWQP